jgi:predicted RNase H-like HicB family nuclease
MPVVVQPADSGFVATFFDANVSMSGETQEEAVDNLRGLLVDLLEDLQSEPAEHLGPEPRRQLHALKAVMRRSG